MSTKVTKVADNPKVHGPESGHTREGPDGCASHEPLDAYRLGNMLIVSHGLRQHAYPLPDIAGIALTGAVGISDITLTLQSRSARGGVVEMRAGHFCGDGHDVRAQNIFARMNIATGKP